MGRGRGTPRLGSGEWCLDGGAVERRGIGRGQGRVWRPVLVQEGLGWGQGVGSAAPRCGQGWGIHKGTREERGGHGKDERLWEGTEWRAARPGSHPKLK